MTAGARPAAPYAGLFVVSLGASLATMDLAVNVAFPAITEAFALETRSIQWLIICYVLTYSSLMLVFGRLGDRIGYRQVFRAGLIVCAIAFVLCAMAPTYGSLLAARVVQGIGSALVLSCAPALATLLFDESRRVRALGHYSALISLGSVLAPLIGGAAIVMLGWSGVFWYRAPLAVLALVLLPLLPRAAWSTTHQAAGERRSPTLRSMLRNADFLLPNVAGVVVNFAAFAVPLLVPYYLVRIAGLSAFHSGAVIALSPIGLMLGSAIAARAVEKLGVHRAALLGSAGVAAASIAIALWSSAPWLPFILASLLIHGVGLGVFTVAYTDIVIGALPRGDRGVAGSLTMVTRTIGVMSAAAALTALLDYVDAHRRAAGASEVTAFADSFSFVFLAVAVLVATYAGLSLLRASGFSRR